MDDVWRSKYFVKTDFMMKSTMKKCMQFLNWRLCLVVLLGLSTGCNQLDIAEDDLTFPTSGDINSSSDFSAREQTSRQFAWNDGDGIACVNIPEAGDYLLTYMTKFTKSHQLSKNTPSDPFVIVFRANAPAQLYVSFSPDEVLSSFMLQRGTVKEDAIGLYDDGPIIRYASPSIPTIFWNDVFTLPPHASPLSVVKGKFACPPSEVTLHHALKGF